MQEVAFRILPELIEFLNRSVALLPTVTTCKGKTSNRYCQLQGNNRLGTIPQHWFGGKVSRSVSTGWAVLLWSES
jgi:hypothetical protein